MATLGQILFFNINNELLNNQFIISAGGCFRKLQLTSHYVFLIQLVHVEYPVDLLLEEDGIQ